MQIIKKATSHIRGCFAMMEGDILLGSYPRSGSTWLRTICANTLLLSRKQGEFCEMKDLLELMPVLGASNLSISQSRNPRLIKTHRNFNHIYPCKPNRCVHLWRNPVDVMHSGFRYYQSHTYIEIPSTFSDFIRTRNYGMPSWNNHYTSWNKNATLTITYEDLREDPLRTMTALYDHIGYDELTTHLNTAIENANIQNMRASEKKGTRDPERFRKDHLTIGSGLTDSTTTSNTDYDYINSFL